MAHQLVARAELLEHGLLAEVQSAVGYQSSSTLWLSFGLGAEPRYAELRVRWPYGRDDVFPGGPANRRLTVVEGRGIVADEAFR